MEIMRELKDKTIRTRTFIHQRISQSCSLTLLARPAHKPDRKDTQMSCNFAHETRAPQLKEAPAGGGGCCRVRESAARRDLSCCVRHLSCMSSSHQPNQAAASSEHSSSWSCACQSSSVCTRRCLTAAPAVCTVALHHHRAPWRSRVFERQLISFD